MSELKELIVEAKQKDVKAMGELFNQFKPLLKSRSKKYSKYGQKYEDVFQQAALIFILAVYDYKEEKNIPFSGYIMQRKVEVPSGLNPTINHR
jgi:DNA-directed RNA polymerase specialized sigma subunit